MDINYFVIIGDMVESKKLDDRLTVQENFKTAIYTAKTNRFEHCISPLTITIGDEFQTVLDGADQLFGMLEQIESDFHDASLRYGLGVGRIETAINREQAIGMDGPAFHAARQALDKAKRENRLYYFKCEDSFSEERINIFLNWIGTTIRRWNNEKRRILNYYHREWTQQKIAGQLKISQSAVSQHINSAYFKLTYRTQQQVQDEINVIMKGV